MLDAVRVGWLRTKRTHPLHNAASRGDLNAITLLLQHGEPLNDLDRHGRTALGYAAEKGQVEAVRLLLEGGADANTTDSSDQTALLRAALADQGDIVQELIQRGADVAVTNHVGTPVFFVAISRGRVNAVNAMLASGVSVHAPGKFGHSPLRCAAENSQLAVVQTLIEHGADVNARDGSGDLPLIRAARLNYVAVVAALLERGADVNAVNARDETALFGAAQLRRQSTVEVLLRHIASSSANYTEEAFAFLVAVAMSDTQALSELIANGTPVDTPLTNHRTPLDFAVDLDRTAVVRLLIQHGASVAPKPSSRESMLVRAGSHGFIRVFEALIQAGAAVNVVDRNRWTPLMQAAEWDFSPAVQLLVAHGGSALHIEDIQDSGHPLLPTTLASLKVLSRRCLWFSRLFDIFMARVQATVDELRHAGRVRGVEGEHVAVSLCGILFRFCRLVVHTLRLDTTALAMFIAARTTIATLNELHEELDHFCTLAALKRKDTTWKEESSQYALATHAALTVAVLCTASGLAQQCTDYTEHDTALVLQYELDKCSGDPVTLFANNTRAVLAHFSHQCGIETPVVVPAWFIHRNELSVHMWNLSTFEGVVLTYEGKWRQSSVTLRVHNVKFDAFDAIATKWHRLSHPHVVKLFGGTHVGMPQYLIYESVPGATQLYVFLSDEANRKRAWSCLYEAALGLQYLHSQDVVHGNLRSEAIIVGADGTTKLFGNPSRYYYALSGSNRYGEHWQAPEILDNGAVATLASDVYAFGVCIWEALTHELPWQATSYFGEANKQAKRRGLPSRPASMDDAAYDLISHMCAVDPSERVAIAAVVHRLKQLATQPGSGSGNASSKKTMVQSSQQAKTALDTFVFPELDGSTIPKTLQFIQTRCEKLTDDQWMATNVCPALVFIYEAFCKRHKTPGEVEVIQFCATLARVARYVRTAVSDKSVYALARSRRVAESHRLVYAELDRLLTSLDVSVAHRIRAWHHEARGDSSKGDSGDDSDSDSPEATAAPPAPATALDTAVATSNAVTLHHYDSAEDHACWTQAGLAETSRQADPSWRLPLQDLIFSTADQIGQGAFGAVFKGTWLDTPVVIKFMGYEEDIETISTDLLLHEVRIWHRLIHPHVLRLYGASHIDKRYFVCEFAGNGDLLDYLRKHERGSKHLTWQKLHEAALGLQYLHSMNVAHNDLKCDNIMVGLDHKAKLIDFGLSCLIDAAEIQIDVQRIGAVNWRSPEYLTGKRPSCASDVYSFAMCILEAVSGDVPWGRHMLPTIVKFHIKKGKLPALLASMTPKQCHLIQLMTKFEPFERASMAFVVNTLEEIAQTQMAAQALA